MPIKEKLAYSYMIVYITMLNVCIIITDQDVLMFDVTKHIRTLIIVIIVFFYLANYFLACSNY